MKIESGTGNGLYAGVDEENRLMVTSVTVPLQHEASKEHFKAFQVWGEATLANGTVTPLIITNSSTTETANVTYMRFEVIDPAGGTALPNASNYVQFGTDVSYSTGGTAKTPVNMYLGSNTLSNVTCYEGSPTLTGTLTAFDREYVKGEGEMSRYSKEGSLVVPPGQSVAVQYTGDHTSGKIYARVSFFMTPIGELT